MSVTSAETLRYRILERVAPGFRHKLLGGMQPIALLTHLVSKKIEVDEKEPEYLLKCLQEIKGSVKAASKTIDDLFTWLNPAQEIYLPLNAVIAECLDLLKMEIYASNVTFQNDVVSNELVRASTVRSIFTASLLTYIDTVDKASKVIISDRLNAKSITIEMALSPSADRADKTLGDHASFVDWDDIKLISENAYFFITSNLVIISRIT